MSNIVIKATDISKQYRLGLVGSGTLKDDMARFWAQIRGKEDPTLKVGQVNDRTQQASSDYVWALKNIDFEVKQGEILGIIGKNGAGKSTLLKILSKITAPTTGSIKIKGRIASLLEVGTGFHGELTGRENIYINGAVLGMSRREVTRKLDEIVAFAGVEKYMDTPVKRYSSGMTVRLGFAVAAHLDPDILVIDEVLTVGDAEFQKKAIGKMQDVSRQEGRTILFVSHNMESVRKLCTRGILLENGSISYEGKIESIIDKYLSVDTSMAGTEKYFEIENDKDFQVVKANLVNQEGKPKSNFDIKDDIYIQLNCISRKPIAQLYGYFAIYNSNSDLVWESDSKDTDNNIFDSLAKGEHIITLKIPSNHLIASEYTCYLNFTSPSLEEFQVFNLGHCLKFNIHDTFTKRGNKRNGYFSTIIEWK